MSYLDSLGKVSPSFTGAKRVKDVLAALVPPSHTAVAADAGAGSAMVKAEPKKSVTKIALELAPGIAGGVVLATAWKSHRVLGFLIGHAAASAVYPLLSGDAAEKKRALCQLGVEGSGVAGALLTRRHPALGWLAGIAAGSAVTAFIPGSAAHDEGRKLFEKLKAAI